MRAAVGLVSVLVTALIIALLWVQYNAPVAHVAPHARQEASQMAGRNIDGSPAADSITLTAVEKQNGTLSGLTVATIAQGSAMDEYYGLQAGDVISQIGPMAVGSSPIDTLEDGKNFLVDALEHKYDLVVDRGGQTLHLPAQKNSLPTPPAAANAPAATDSQAAAVTPGNATTSPALPPRSNPPRNAQGQVLDLLNKVGSREDQ